MVEQLIADTRVGAKATVDSMRRDPEWTAEADMAEEALEEETTWISDELPIMLLGQIPVYLLSVLETALSECLAVAAAARGLSEPRAPRRAKLEGYVQALEEVCAVGVRWDTEIWRELRAWRRRRNSMVHGLDFSLDAVSRRNEFVLEDYWQAGEIPDPARVQDLLHLVSRAIEELDQAMYRADIR